MPATWGYGAAGSEPITMAGWGFLTDLAGAEVPSAIYSAIEIDTSYPSEELKSKYSATAQATSYSAKTDQE